ncbi:MAG: hypothetical protein WC562_05445 [Dehalococcoidia bacterium]
MSATGIEDAGYYARILLYVCPVFIGEHIMSTGKFTEIRIIDLENGH